MHVHRKAYKELTDLRLVQSVQAHNGAVWTMKFSVCGTMLATAGQDGLVKVWKVLHRPEMDVAVLNGGGDPSTGAGAGMPVQSLRVFDETPMRVYRGHSSDVLDLSWSRSRFLLSSSMDQTVRLWHSSMDECLRIFKHPDFVTAIDFDPSDDRFFLSGSLDEKLRMWNIPEKRVDDSVDVREMITAMRFLHHGETAVVGTHTGKCMYYSLEENNLDYVTQIDVGRSGQAVATRGTLGAGAGAGAHGAADAASESPTARTSTVRGGTADGDDESARAPKLGARLTATAQSMKHSVKSAAKNAVTSARDIAATGKAYAVRTAMGAGQGPLERGHSVGSGGARAAQAREDSEQSGDGGGTRGGASVAAQRHGKKVTGLMMHPSGDRRLLVTTNDSRLRLYDSYSLICKYKGAKIASSHIRASFDPTGNFVLSGSEDSRVYVWSTFNSYVPAINPLYTGYRKDRSSSFECFEAQDDVVTSALFAPQAARRRIVLSASADGQEEPAPPTRAAVALSGGALSAATTSTSAEAIAVGAATSHGATAAPGDGTSAGLAGGAADGGAGASSSTPATPRHANPDIAEAILASERAVAEGMGVGQVIITAGFGGFIVAYENFGGAQWL